MDIETDYLIVGAGASGLAFADSLLAEADVDVVLVDRRERPGGHWTDAYPFVQLHTPSAYYGVTSTPLGQDRLIESGRNQGFYEQAGADEICAYYEGVVDALTSSGRARFLGGHDHLGDGQLRDLRTGDMHTVSVRQRLVDATVVESSIPATHQPSFTVAAEAAFGPINDLPDVVEQYERFTVIGAGKTSVDACLWLLDQDVSPDRIRWIRPRDMWFNDRAALQPLDQVAEIMYGLSLDTEAGCPGRERRRSLRPARVLRPHAPARPAGVAHDVPGHDDQPGGAGGAPDDRGRRPPRQAAVDRGGPTRARAGRGADRQRRVPRRLLGAGPARDEAGAHVRAGDDRHPAGAPGVARVQRRAGRLRRGASRRRRREEPPHADPPLPEHGRRLGSSHEHDLGHRDGVGERARPVRVGRGNPAQPPARLPRAHGRAARPGGPHPLPDRTSGRRSSASLDGLA